MGTSRSVVERSRRHPLQRLHSPSTGISGAVHAIGLINFYNCFKFLVNNPNAISESFGWHLQYLTIIGIMISSLCFTSGLLADMTHSHTLFTIKNYLALVAAPIEVLISLLYWSLRFIDQSFVVPPDLPMLPIASDVGFHLAPAILLTVDALFLSPPWPSQPINPSASLITFMTSTALAFLYWFWIELCYSRNGFYPYPIFALLSTLQRIILFAGSGVAMWAIGVGLRWAYCTINGVEDIIYTAQKKVE